MAGMRGAFSFSFARSRLWLLGISLVLFVLLANNLIYYFLTRGTLERGMERELATLASQIQLSIENSQTASRYLEEQIAIQLRTAAVGAQFALDPDVERVSNEQLKELSAKLGIDHITLMKKTADDIVLYKSSYPKEIGVPTKSWKPWYQAFQQLFANKQVTIDWGQSLPNFWSGPFEYASSDPTKLSVNKWGYYYDGTTNYIIDPFVSENKFEEFQTTTGIGAILGKTLSANPQLLEIAGINPSTYGKEDLITRTNEGEAVPHKVTRPIIFGSNAFEDKARDSASISMAVAYKKAINDVYAIRGTKVMKSFIPIAVTPSADLVAANGQEVRTYVLVMTSRYDSVQSQLGKQFWSLGLQTAIVTLVSIAAVLGAARLVRRQRERSVRETQDAYIEEVSQLFTVVKGQRHDFLNHVQIIHSLVAMNKMDEVRRYTKELVGDIRQVSDIVAIGDPAIAALVQAKTAIALNKNIQFSHHFGEMKRWGVGIKSVDVVRIVGNLVDNAFDAVMDLPPVSRRVELHGRIEEGYFHVTVRNEGCKLTEEQRKHIFEPGYTTKNGEHSGLGLSITMSLLQQYKGFIRLEADEEHGTAFHVSLPVY